MFGRLGEGERWRAAASWLGLVAYRSNAPVDECKDWPAMVRVVGTPMSATYATGNLMVGSRAGRNVMVALTEIKVLDRDFDSSQEYWRVVGFKTHAIAAVEPSLGIGLSMQTTASTGGGAHLPDVVVGHPTLDARYHIASADPERARTLLYTMRGEQWDAADVLVRLADQGVYVDITDSVVRLFQHQKILDPLILGVWLDHATWLAGALVDARRRMPRAEYEQRYIETLVAAGSSLRLDVDEANLSLAGSLGNVRTTVHLGSFRGGVYTSIHAIVPTPVAYGLRIERSSGTRSALATWFSNTPPDVTMGIPAIDGVLRIQGYPPEHVRWAVHRVGAKVLEVLPHVGFFQVDRNLVRVDLRRIELHPQGLVQAIRDVAYIAEGLSAQPTPA